MTVPSEELPPLKMPTVPQWFKWVAIGSGGTLTILAIALGAYWFAHRHDVKAFGVLIPTDKSAAWVDVSGVVPHDNCRTRKMKVESRLENRAVIVDLTWVQVGPTRRICTLEYAPEETHTVRVKLNRPYSNQVVYDGSVDRDNRVPPIGRTDESRKRVVYVRSQPD
jgi:hypothetical protein